MPPPLTCSSTTGEARNLPQAADVFVDTWLSFLIRGFAFVPKSDQRVMSDEGKRKRPQPGFFAQMHEDGSDSDAPVARVREPQAKPAAAAAPAGASKKREKRHKRSYCFWPHSSHGPNSEMASDVVVHADVDLSLGTRPGSAEVKIMNLTAGQQREGEGEKPQWGGSCTVPPRELKAIRHKMPKDNTDLLIICARDPLFGDVYVYKHIININHDYKFHAKTFRALDPRPDMIDGEPPPGRHRDVAALQAWIDHLTTWCGGPPILIIHFHGEAEDNLLDEQRPTAPAGVRIVRGVGVGDVAPAGAELTHTFLRARLQKYVLARIRSDPIKAFDNGDWLPRMEAFERAFLDSGSNAAFGELGCVIAQDALRADGALATARHPFRNHHYDLLFSY